MSHSFEEPWRYDDQEAAMIRDMITSTANRDAAVIPSDGTVVTGEMSDFQKQMLATSLDGPVGANGEIPPAGV